MSYKSFEYVVRGQVQNVGFRQFAKRVADKEGVVGWVKNDRHGNVVGVAQGQPDALEQFKQALARGPPLAVVSKVEIPHEKTVDSLDFASFDIRL